MMDDRHLREEKSSGESILEGNFLNIFRDTVRLPDGNSAIREYVVHPGAVMIIPLIEYQPQKYKIILERQFRYPVGRVMIEFPAGKLDLDESPFHCAQRELLEETGYVASEWAFATTLHPVISYSTEVIHIWFARGLVQGERKLDTGEFLDVFSPTSIDLIDWCRSGKVTDGKTLTGVLWLQNVLNGSWKLDWQDVKVAS